LFHLLRKKSRKNGRVLGVEHHPYTFAVSRGHSLMPWERATLAFTFCQFLLRVLLSLPCFSFQVTACKFTMDKWMHDA